MTKTARGLVVGLFALALTGCLDDETHDGGGGWPGLQPDKIHHGPGPLVGRNPDPIPIVHMAEIQLRVMTAIRH